MYLHKPFWKISYTEKKKNVEDRGTLSQEKEVDMRAENWQAQP